MERKAEIELDELVRAINKLPEDQRNIIIEELNKKKQPENEEKLNDSRQDVPA